MGINFKRLKRDVKSRREKIEWESFTQRYRMVKSIVVGIEMLYTVLFVTCSGLLLLRVLDCLSPGEWTLPEELN